MQTFLADVRYGGRVLHRSPGFSLVAIAALAIGIGLNLTIFGFANELLLRPPPGIADPTRVVRVFTNRFSGTAQPDYEAYRDRNHTFVALAAFRPEQHFGLGVSGNYFSTLGVFAAGPTRSTLRGVLMTSQVAMSALLLVLAGLFVRGLTNARQLDVGMITDGASAQIKTEPSS